VLEAKKKYFTHTFMACTYAKYLFSVVKAMFVSLYAIIQASETGSRGTPRAFDNELVDGTNNDGS